MVINFFGRRGSGKTVAIKGNIKYCRSPVVILDILGNYENEEYYQTNSLSDAISFIREHFESEKQVVVCLRTNDPTQAADYVSAALWECEGGTLILDEIDSIRIKEGSCFDSIIRYGRNRDVDIITGCRRPAELDKNITAAANKFYCFQTHEIRDIEYFEACIFGEKAEELLRLKRYNGLYVDYDNEITGKFHTDIGGNIFYDSKEPLE